jgi:hypothetical protein
MGRIQPGASDDIRLRRTAQGEVLLRIDNQSAVSVPHQVLVDLHDLV